MLRNLPIGCDFANMQRHYFGVTVFEGHPFASFLPVFQITAEERA
jgi:hypothetical protein